MNHRTQDLIAWDHFPHSPSRVSHSSTTLRLPPAFWGRLVQHVRSACQSHGSRALWERWLTAEGVAAVETGTAGQSADFVGMTTLGGGRLRDTVDLTPDVITNRVRKTLTASPASPLALSFHTGATSKSRPSRSYSYLYYVVLANGASLTVRADAAGLEAEDCFFSRAAVELAEEGDGNETDETYRQAVVGELVRRYADLDVDKRFVLPGKDAADTRMTIRLPLHQATFLKPESWGFSGSESGAQWEGYRPSNSGTNRLTAAGHASRMSRPTRLPALPPRRLPLSPPGTSAAQQESAYATALAAGYQSLFGDGDSRPLTTAQAIAGAHALARRLGRWTPDAEDLRDRLQSLGGAAAEDVRLGLLESRMEAWAAYLAIDAAYAAVLEAGDDAPGLSEAVNSLLARIESFDDALQHCEPCLAVSDGTPLLANWRKRLAPPYRDALPWWLDRTPALAASLDE